MFWRIVLLMMMVNGMRTDDHYIIPTITLRSCSAHTVLLDITGLQAGGLMFIRTDAVYNMQPTVDGTAVYTCTFDYCGVVWEDRFEFVVQRRTTVQTTHDVHLTFMCIPDTNPILSDDGTSNDMGDINVTRFIYSATADMRFYWNNTELASGSFIRLGTEIEMVIRITNNFEDFIDINIKACTAATMYMFENRCPVDYELMGEFNKTGIGAVQNTFPMIRPTSTIAGPLDVLFSCIVEVCRTPCQTYICNGTNPESAVMETRRKRQTSQAALRSIMVGATFSVGMEDIVVVEEEGKDDCVALHVFIIAVATLSFLMLVSIATLLFYYSEWKSVLRAEFKRSCMDSETDRKCSEITKTPNDIETASRNPEDSDWKRPGSNKKISSLVNVTFDPLKPPTNDKIDGVGDLALNIDSDTTNLNCSKSKSEETVEEKVSKKKVKSVQFILENEHGTFTCMDTSPDEISPMEYVLRVLKETNGQTSIDKCVQSTDQAPIKLKSALKQPTNNFPSDYLSNDRKEEGNPAVKNVEDTKLQDKILATESMYWKDIHVAYKQVQFLNLKPGSEKAVNQTDSQTLNHFSNDRMKGRKDTHANHVRNPSDDQEEAGSQDTSRSENQDGCEENKVDLDRSAVDKTNTCAEKVDLDSCTTDKDKEEKYANEKALQRTLAKEALLVTVGKLDPILQRFQNTLSVVKENSSLQKTESMRRLISETDSDDR